MDDTAWMCDIAGNQRLVSLFGKDQFTELGSNVRRWLMRLRASCNCSGLALFRLSMPRPILRRSGFPGVRLETRHTASSPGRGLPNSRRCDGLQKPASDTTPSRFLQGCSGRQMSARQYPHLRRQFDPTPKSPLEPTSPRLPQCTCPLNVLTTFFLRYGQPAGRHS
jgi:hypothetical protein